MLQTIEAAVSQLRGLKLSTAGLCSTLPPEHQRDAGTLLLHVNDVLGWLEIRAHTLREAQAQIGMRPRDGIWH